jgi:hypothetical protein
MTKDEYKKQWARENREKMNASQRKYWQKNREKLLQQARLRRQTKGDPQRIKREYGLSKEEFDKMIHDQNNRCAICGNTSIRRLDVDHDHVTGKVRGLLCGRCNKGIGLFDDNKELFGKVILYLTEHS